METTPDTEITLTHGDWKLVTAPYGASLRGLLHNGAEVIKRYSGEAGKVGGQGDVLITFPGRVTEGPKRHPRVCAKKDLGQRGN